MQCIYIFMVWNLIARLMLRISTLSQIRCPSIDEFGNQNFIIILRSEVSDVRGAARHIRSTTCSSTTRLGYMFERCVRGFGLSNVCERSLRRLRSHPAVESVHADSVIVVLPSSDECAIVEPTTGANWFPWGMQRVGATGIQCETGNNRCETGNNRCETGIRSESIRSETETGPSSTTSITVDADIFIIDTGIEPTHPDLNVGSLGAGFVPHSPGTSDENGHGTHVAGIAAAHDNAYGCVGVCPGARVHPVRCMDAIGAGQFSWVIAGVEHVQSIRCRHPELRMVANISLGASTPTSTYNVLDMAVSRAIASGVTFCVAAGNLGMDAKFCSPAHVTTAITVAAIDQSDRIPPFSNFGSSVTLFAPGTDILSTHIGSRCAFRSGTSMASPFVAGAAAFFLSHHPTSRPAAVKLALINASRVSSAPSSPYLSSHSARCLWMPPLYA